MSSEVQVLESCYKEFTRDILTVASELRWMCKGGGRLEQAQGCHFTKGLGFSVCNLSVIGSTTHRTSCETCHYYLNPLLGMRFSSIMSHGLSLDPLECLCTCVSCASQFGFATGGESSLPLCQSAFSICQFCKALHKAFWALNLHPTACLISISGFWLNSPCPKACHCWFCLLTRVNLGLSYGVWERISLLYLFLIFFSF